MPTSKATSHADKVIHIIGTYGLSLQSGVRESFRQLLCVSTHRVAHLLSEEEAAMLLADHLYPALIAGLRSGVDASAIDDMLEVWLRFAQQAIYRSNLGLISMALFDDEILPLIDDVDRALREEYSENDPFKAKCAARVFWARR